MSMYLQDFFLDLSTLAVMPLVRRDARELGAARLAGERGAVTKRGPFYTVRSERSDRGYLVRFDGARFVCECRDYEYRSSSSATFECKHGKAVRIARAAGSVEEA